MSPAADRNLLFGILALQMDFITRDQLVAGMNAWVLEKTKPLGEVLRHQGVLGPERQQLLDALVAEHLKQHNNDPQQSLASLNSPSPLLGNAPGAGRSLRKDLEQFADADVQASLLHLPKPRDESSNPAGQPPTISYHPAAGARFRILRPHAEGGLGKVSVALDEELNREVALKEIKDLHADSADSRGRFLLEAEITGGLEHPGIVPVYSLGTYADGRPFYAMRFIKGDSLKEAIENFHQRDGRASSRKADVVADDTGHVGLTPRRSPDFSSLDFRQLLGRFIDVCNAIAYAHSRGVLHRDLKPGNIMLGKYGETLVVDWGLAKAVGRAESRERPGDDEPTLKPSSGSSDQTIPGSALGTPAYMSPEQAAGRLDLLGPASDVYSLGATLYQVLTGQPAFSEPDIAAILHKVRRGDFVPPRQRNPQIPAALEAICLKAMALEPQNRYAAAKDLADDIEHWLADASVSAYSEPLGMRIGRIYRQAPLGSLYVTLCVLISGSFTLLATAWIFNSKFPLLFFCAVTGPFLIALYTVLYAAALLLLQLAWSLLLGLDWGIPPYLSRGQKITWICNYHLRIAPVMALIVWTLTTPFLVNSLLANIGIPSELFLVMGIGFFMWCSIGLVACEALQYGRSKAVWRTLLFGLFGCVGAVVCYGVLEGSDVMKNVIAPLREGRPPVRIIFDPLRNTRPFGNK